LESWERVSGIAIGRDLLLHVLTVAAASLLLIGLVAPPAFAVESVESERSLDPLRSLVGGCTKPENLDPVEDPGCATTPPPSAHPPALFATPTSVATDFYGNMYVANFGKSLAGTEGRIDIFDPDGVFITEVKPPSSPLAVQVDSKGNLYVVVTISGTVDFLRYAPTTYDGNAGTIVYGSPVNFGHSAAEVVGLALNRVNDHLFFNLGAGGVREYSSAEEGNEVVRTVELGVWPYGSGVAVDAAHDRLYASDEGNKIRIFKLAAPSELVGTIEGSDIPEGEFLRYLSVTVDEGTGHFFVLDGDANRIYEFAGDGSYVSTLEHGFQVFAGTQINVDNGAFSPNGGLSTKGRYLYVPSHKSGTGHSFAFYEPTVCVPKVESASASNPTESEVELQGSVNPCGAETTYSFEYTTLQHFEEEGFTGAASAGSGQLPALNQFEDVSVDLNGLLSGTSYRFRLVATNVEGSAEAEGSFGTYPSPPLEPVSCSNGLFRVGVSDLLPDCRAYELVTPPDTNGRAPVGTGHLGSFTNRQVSPAGDKLPFRVEGGSLPGFEATGSYLGDPYLATRGSAGWTTALIGPTGSEATDVEPGGTSPDQGYAFWTATGEGPLVIDGKFTTYERYPDGHVELLGEGSLATDPQVNALLLSENGTHALFSTGSISKSIQLEPDAAPSGTNAIYDRGLDGNLRVISLAPGSVPFKAGEEANYQGASIDGKGVAFEVGQTLYLRYDNSESYEIGEDVTFAGVAEGGNRIFFLEEGKLLRFDALTGEVTPFSTSEVTPVIVSPDGTAAYFISTKNLTGSAPNPQGAKAKPGQRNLYLSKEGTISFVGTVTERDVVGVSGGGGTQQVDGLGLLTESVGPFPAIPGRLADVPARTTTDGSDLLFQSRAPLTGFDPNEHPQVFRYDSANEELDCLSCNPTTTVASGDATFQSLQRASLGLFYPTAWLENLRADGRRAFFQSTEALVPGDTDGLQDVYEWEDQGVGSCTAPGGCLYLISSGHSVRDDYLWAVSRSGDDVFVLTSDLLLPADADETVSIYDARVDGGFPGSPPPPDCQGEGCRPRLSPPPVLPAAATPANGSGENFKPRRTCRKGQRKVKRGGKVRCVKKHRRHQASAKRKGAHR
jgi:hypothetical protein